MRKQQNRIEVSPGYYTLSYGKGEPCKKGETAAKSGCVPAGEDEPKTMEDLVQRVQDAKDGDAAVEMLSGMKRDDLLQVAEQIPGIVLPPNASRPRILTLISRLIDRKRGDEIILGWRREK